jgi:tRNA A-37 threonylcarbamoyl transferase component Bud32
MQREISSREIIYNYFNRITLAQLSTLRITSILAVVVDRDLLLLRGILMPHASITIEYASHDQITVQHLLSLVNIVRYLHTAGVIHGDIYTRNICINRASTQLINFGEIALEYRNDIVAVSELLL